jgi:hypothetical protein
VITADVITALALPPESRVEQRVPKKLLVEHGAPTAADKRQINEGIEELLWMAALKPTTVGIPAFRDGTREYLEIAVLSLALRPSAKASRLVELVHRAVPYPLLLVTEQADAVAVSLAHKLFAENEAGKVVLDETVRAGALGEHATTAEFLATMPLAAQPRGNLFALYQGWVDSVESLLAAQLTGRFARAEGIEAATKRREALAVHDRLRREMAALRAQAERESQLPRRVELNQQIKRLDAELAEAVANL